MSLSYFRLAAVALALLFAAAAPAQETRLVLDRGDSTIVLEPYAPNIIRVTLSLLRQPALSPPGYGFTGAPSAAGAAVKPYPGGARAGCLSKLSVTRMMLGA